MKGLYNGSYMRAFKILPRNVIMAANLSKAALKRLSWFDWYHAHEKNISLTCRHFGISRDTFYLWKKRFNPRNLRSLEDDTKTRRPHNLRQMTTPRHNKKIIFFIILKKSQKKKKKKQKKQKK